MTPIEAEQICLSAEQAFRHGNLRLANFPKLLKRIITERLWERRQVPGHGVVELRNLYELVTSEPRKGWGEDPAKIEAVIKDDPEVLSLWREAITPEKHKHTSDNNNIIINQGTSKSYTLTRLKREAPELYERVVKKELSANAAAIQAGFREKSVTIPLNIQRAADCLSRHFSKEECRELARLLRA